MIDLRRLAFDKGLGQSELGNILNIAQSQVSLMMNGRRDMTQAHIDLLSAHFGADVIAHYIIDDKLMEAFRTPHARQVDATIIPAEIVEEVKAEVLSEAAIPIIPPAVANETNIDIRKFIDDKGGELEHINPNDLTHQADGAERIRKTSMLPTFAPGDIVFIRFLKDKTNIIDGHTYYFDMRTRPTMIRKVKIEGDKLRLIAKNPAFGDMLVTYDDILNIADIVGLFRCSFGDQYDEIEAVRRKKEEQVDKLIAQNGEALKIIGSMIQNKQ